MLNPPFSIYETPLLYPSFFQVLPGLYVGNYRDSKDVNQLSKHNITHILAIHDTARKLHPVSHDIFPHIYSAPFRRVASLISIRASRGELTLLASIAVGESPSRRSRQVIHKCWG